MVPCGALASGEALLQIHRGETFVSRERVCLPILNRGAEIMGDKAPKDKNKQKKIADKKTAAKGAGSAKSGKK